MMEPSRMVEVCRIKSPRVLPIFKCVTLLISSFKSFFCDVVSTALLAITESNSKLFVTHPTFNVLIAFSNAWLEKFGSLSASDDNPLLTGICYPAKTFGDPIAIAPKSAESPDLATGLPSAKTVVDPVLITAGCPTHLSGQHTGIV